MPFRQYFGGIRVELRSPLSPSQLKERINSEASFGLSPFYTGVVGRVWGNSLRLGYRSSIFEYNQKPLLAGRIESIPSGSRLRLTYRAPRTALVFFAFWYVFIVFILVSASIALFENREVETGLFLAVMLALALAPIAMHFWGTRRFDEELTDLLDFLRLEANATPAEK